MEEQRRSSDDDNEDAMNKQIDIRHIAAVLSDPDRAECPSTFPRDTMAASSPGLYSWWADSTAEALFAQVGYISTGQCIYIGQAGATQPSGKTSSATLKSRILNNHIRGNASSSTFRLTISAILRDPLDLHLVKPESVTPDDNRRVSGWIRDHLRVTIMPVDDRNSLKKIEQEVIDMLDPPFNLDKRHTTALRQHLKELRKRFREQPRG